MLVESRLAVPGFPGYLVSDLGNVYSLWRREWAGARGQGQLRGSRMVIAPEEPRPLRLFDRLDMKKRSTGYMTVGLALAGRTMNRYVHDLVLSAFVGPRPSPEHEACHGPGGRADNRLANLRWGTTRENCEDRVEAGTQYAGDTWRMARGILPRALEGTLIPESDHAFAGLGLDVGEAAE